ncbi:MAG: LuxR C-terminal-related transcriptional regulator [Anaerolineales bacterium]|nr:LuxR C-terminal-related transcriptional regulator [Anaerolineales bacterium]
MLHASQPAGTEILLSGLINEIVEIHKPFVIVLDDYHIITNPEIHEILTFMVENQPLEMHLVVSSRADPPWPLARWRARREMIEIRTQDLRFGPEEAADLLNGVMQLGLSDDDVERLEARTEGWIAGLLMAAISLQGRQDPSGFIRAFEGSHRYIFDYLVEEVLNQLTPEIQNFLLKTSILEQLNAPLCDAILDSNNSQSVLHQLEQLNLFIIPLDDQRQWYRYHHLFADLLAGLLGELHPDLVPGLHLQASFWFETHGQLWDTVRHALAAGDVGRVARVAEVNVLGIMERGELGTLIRWLNELPGELIDDYPWLKVAQAWALTQAGSFDTAIPCLASAEDSLKGKPGISKEQADHIKGHITAIRSYIEILSFGNYTRAAQLAQQSLEHLPPSDLRTRGMATGFLGTIQRVQQDFTSALTTLSSALTIYRATHQPYVVIDLLSQIGRVRRDQGLLHETARICQEALEIADRYARGGQHRLPVAAYAMGILGRVYYEWNQLDKALEIGSQALALSKRWGQANTLLGNHLFVAKIYRAQGIFQEALASIQAAKETGSRFSDTHEFVLGTQEMVVRLAMGDIHSVEQWVQQKSASYDTNPDERLWELAPLILALYGAKRVDSMDEFLSVLDRLLAVFDDKGIHRRSMEAHIYRAMVLQALKADDRALVSMEAALTKAEPEGYIRSFLDQGAPMEYLLKNAIAAGIKVTYASQLLTALQADLHGKMNPQEGLSVPLVEPLTKRETEVLRLLAANLTIPNIAAELVITTGTLRTHIKRIYNKLDAHSRFEAVTRAQDLGLL